MKRIILFFINKDIEHYFKFLHERGYKITNTRYLPERFGNWIANLESSICGIEIYSHQGELNLVFTRFGKDHKETRISVEAMIYFMSKYQEFVGGFETNLFPSKKRQLERLANLLKNHIDQIEPYFESNFENIRIELAIAQKKYNEEFIERFKQRRN